MPSASARHGEGGKACKEDQEERSKKEEVGERRTKGEAR